MIHLHVYRCYYGRLLLFCYGVPFCSILHVYDLVVPVTHVTVDS